MAKVPIASEAPASAAFADHGRAASSAAAVISIAPIRFEAACTLITS